MKTNSKRKASTPKGSMSKNYRISNSSTTSKKTTKDSSHPLQKKLSKSLLPLSAFSLM